METRFLQTLTYNSPFNEHLPYVHGLGSSPYQLRAGPDIFAISKGVLTLVEVKGPRPAGRKKKDK